MSVIIRATAGATPSETAGRALAAHSREFIHNGTLYEITRVEWKPIGRIVKDEETPKEAVKN